MKYVKLLFATSVITCLVYFVGVHLLIDAPIRAEYWVGEMIIIKKELAKRYTGKTKVIVAGGSSTLFGIDAEYASKRLNMPVINFGLHGGLRLDKILKEVSSAIEPGDILVLSLEPTYYGCNEKLSTWQVENIIGWDYDTWENMSFIEKSEFVSLVSPSIFGNMIVADIQRRFFPDSVSERLHSLDKTYVLSKYKARMTPQTFEYSAYNLNDYGDILRTEGAHFKRAGWDFREPRHLCSETASELSSFIVSMKKQRVIVTFANTPYINTGVSKEKIRHSDISFKKEFIKDGCFIDKREELVFDRKLFFNTSLHLNSEGRAVRTDLFINSLRRNLLTGVCQPP